MPKNILLIALVPLLIIALAISASLPSAKEDIGGAPPYAVADDPPEVSLDRYSWIYDWQRPEGPVKVGLQVGHWKNSEVPQELHRLRGNTGAEGGGKTEVEVNMAIAQKTAEILSANGIQVEIIPATIPPKFWADVFVAIHADGDQYWRKSGFKAAHPRRDLSGKADQLQDAVEKEYQKATGLDKDPDVTDNMRGYYAFGWWKYEHAIHPMTPAIILETGFLTSYSDRQTIVSQPEVCAQGLAKGILNYLQE